MGESDSVENNAPGAAGAGIDENRHFIQNEELEEGAMDIDDIRNEPIESSKVARCKKCRRLKFGHPRPFGQNDCQLEPILNDEVLKKDDEEKNKKRLETRKRKSSGPISRPTPEKRSKVSEKGGLDDRDEEEITCLEDERMKLQKMLNVQCKKKEIEEANIRKKKDISDEI